MSEREASEFAGDLPNRRRSKMDKITVNAFIHGGALSDPIELISQFCNWTKITFCEMVVQNVIF